MPDLAGTDPEQPARPRTHAVLIGALVGTVIVVIGLGATLAIVLSRPAATGTPAAPSTTTPAPTTSQPLPSATIECVSNEDGRYGAMVRILNNSDRVQGYSVAVAFDTADGTRQVDVGSGTVATVQPHEPTNLYAIGHLQAPDAQPVPTGSSWADVQKALAAPPRNYRCRITQLVSH